jgi:hypothetical protein
VLDRLRTWFGRLLGRSTETRDDDRDGRAESDERDDSRFVPSPLDRSVRRAHGSGDEEVDRELGRVDGQARELEEANRRD